MELIKPTLTDIYLKNPCSTQPAPLWKTFYMFKDFSGEIKINNEELSEILIYNSTMLHTYLSKNNSHINIDNLDDFDTLLIHERYLSNINLNNYAKPEGYFRLTFNYCTDLTIPMMDRYYFKTVDIPNECETVSKVICNCYEHIKPSKDEVLKWTNYPVFNPDLWVWIVDKATNEYAGLGIAELDASIGEGSLEWIQILPKYQSQGLGKALITNLLLKLKALAKFITVSGEVDNKYHPENLYRKCGFYGDDVWYVLKKNKVGVTH